MSQSIPAIGSVWTCNNVIFKVTDIAIERGTVLAKGKADGVPASIAVGDLSTGFQEVQPALLKRLHRTMPVRITGQFQALRA